MDSDSFKPLSVQFEIEDKNVADKLRQLADLLGDKRGDRRLRGAAVAKEIVYAAIRSGIAAQLLGLTSSKAEESGSSTSRNRSKS
jgi:hypothetical protein